MVNMEKTITVKKAAIGVVFRYWMGIILFSWALPGSMDSGKVHEPVSYTQLDVYKRQSLIRHNRLPHHSQNM